MIIAIILAHLVGDYILQWDNLSRWKSQALSGALVHGAIVLLVTLLFTLPFDPSWWPWALFIGLSHTLIDAAQVPIRRRLSLRSNGMSALSLFLIDQAAHLSIIGLVLLSSGYLKAPSLTADFVAASNDNKFLAFILGYAFLTMPAWIIIKFIVFAIMNGSAPDFSPGARSKYTGMLERGLITTLILLGQFVLVPLAALPRLLLDRPQLAGHGPGANALLSRRATLYFAETLASIALAVAIGLALRQL
jgi:TRAP-type mannitol/chloroaromatic compound transport system permease small subunit